MQQRVLELIERVANEEVVGEDYTVIVFCQICSSVIKNYFTLFVNILQAC